ncbi:hypothetical protein KC19_7G002400 [Ceratodon purpureus]|uniref:Secreted protein n=1 Tax=Ceratodon purpureus TaxID=3225 RepID=A0A8T0H5Q8_CERPU|nr:hypothetical protein KC19_7G002400 [Ceratodon purpureus]
MMVSRLFSLFPIAFCHASLGFFVHFGFWENACSSCSSVAPAHRTFLSSLSRFLLGSHAVDWI